MFFVWRRRNPHCAKQIWLGVVNLWFVVTYRRYRNSIKYAAGLSASRVRVAEVADNPVNHLAYLLSLVPLVITGHRSLCFVYRFIHSTQSGKYFLGLVRLILKLSCIATVIFPHMRCGLWERRPNVTGPTG